MFVSEATLDFSNLVQKLVFYLQYIRMISLADQNDRWAAYAKPGGWNGTSP